jgi:16S rRNA U516 pseudouridylate synthase RsuA-like enzyme
MAKPSLLVSAMLVFIPRPHSVLAIRVRMHASAFLPAPVCSQRNQGAFDPSCSTVGCRAFATSSSSKRRTARTRSPSSSSTSLALQSARSRRPSFTSSVKSPSSPAAAVERRQPKLYGRRGKGGGSRRSESDDGEAEYRADRVLSNRTGKPRSECFELIQQQRVSYLDQQPTGYEDGEDGTKPQVLWRRVPGPKHKVSMRSPLRIDFTEVPMPPPLLYVYHKPKWVLSVRSDPRENRPCMDSRRLHRAGIPEAAAFSSSLHAVGRLDYDSSGLLLLSSDGALTQRILHPKHEIPKEYTAVVTGRVNATRLSERLTEGVETAEAPRGSRVGGRRRPAVLGIGEAGTAVVLQPDRPLHERLL